MKHLTREEAYEVLKKYDEDAYNFYVNNARCFGCDAIRYAEYLLREHAGEELNKNVDYIDPRPDIGDVGWIG